MTEKNKAYVEAIGVLTDIACLLMNRGYESPFDEVGFTVEEVADKLKLPINLVRKAFAELSSFNEKDEKGGFQLHAVDEDDEDDYERVEEILKSHKVIRERAFKDGDLDQKKFFTRLAGYEDTYVMLNARDYSMLSKFLREKYMSGDVLHMDTEEFYKTIPAYTDDSEGNVSIEREIIDAIRKDSDIELLYNSKGTLTKEIIKPLKLIRYGLYGVSYVITIKDGDISSYRIDSIKEINELGGRSTIQILDRSSLSKLPYIWNMDTGSGEADVALKVFADLNGKVIDKVKRDLRQYIQDAGYEIEELESGDIIVRGHVIGKSAFFNWVRGYGSSMVILEPREWGVDMIESVKGKLENYGENI